MTKAECLLNISESREYPKAGSIVDGLNVTSHVPNMDSIAATFYDYEILKGIRKLPFKDFGGPNSVFYAKDDLDRSKSLAEKIKESKRIDPLIIAIDKEGPYILEGAHRFVALHYLKKKHFPALVVLDLDEDE